MKLMWCLVLRGSSPIRILERCRRIGPFSDTGTDSPRSVRLGYGDRHPPKLERVLELTVEVEAPIEIGETGASRLAAVQ
ncbi:hypothetical protein C484_00400 [Natrialba taiwanensis DSM 12281]|uniref:Uncharacterized protein n=1 Tax=Natrialba taiwanensis DSM 12281 TaxID=1230458 RepID=M0AHJ0_9EURY|nr:hypothetical protein C484_00400 [Natrialba taiwanensis DSM 12281]